MRVNLLKGLLGLLALGVGQLVFECGFTIFGLLAAYAEADTFDWLKAVALLSGAAGALVGALLVESTLHRWTRPILAAVVLTYLGMATLVEGFELPTLVLASSMTTAGIFLMIGSMTLIEVVYSEFQRRRKYQ